MKIVIGYQPSFEKEKKTRELKGKSLLELPKDYCVLDIETTGLDATYDDAIEVAIIKVRNNIIVDEFQTYIKTSERIPHFITELTGISQEDVDNAPEADYVWNNVKEFIGDDIIIAHNASFDINFSYDEMIENAVEPIENNFVDTLRLSRLAFPELKNHKLKTLVKELKINTGKLHRAMNDVYATFEIYKQIYENFDLDQFLLDRKNKRKFSANDIQVTETKINDYISNNVFVFTGKLEHYTRKEAMQEIINCGGELTTGVTKKTDYLVMGTYDYYSGIVNGKSSKHKKAELYKSQGQDIQIIPETVFYDMLQNTIN